MTLPPSCPAVGKISATFLSSLISSPPPPELLLVFAAALSFLVAVKSPFSPPPLRIRRHSLPTLSMSSSPSPSRRAALTFSSPESLSDWLKPRLPPGAIASWGASPGTKTLYNLWIEVSNGETSLLVPSPPRDPEDEGASVEHGTSTPLRAVNVATVKIRNHRGALLVESHQLLSDGSFRRRGRPLSEKMLPGEAVEDSVLRAVKEELGVAASGNVRIVPDSYEMRIEEKPSASYPGLPAQYVLHSVEVQVDGLPEDGEFSTEEIGEGVEETTGGPAVFVRKHFWKWVDDFDDGNGDGFISHPGV
ncbi:hypothetical protein AXF42_Ash015430 [Apostasia shenzhenica]|uniref:Uncharacterized protein n=1 Tax=Apostasia shenzhenica TaxID=1088818 RepID=A0A2H9ZS76_9ASPA|nr:hypothetical protein AXF42_Ash015430 [Apostasia shenzhenica]